MKPRWDCQINPQFPVPTMDGIVSGYKTGEAVGEEIAEGNLVGAVEAAGDNEPSTMPASEKPESAKELEEKNAAILRGADASMSWGGSGETSTFHERNATTIPPGALATVGIAPQQSSTTSPTPSDFHAPVKPDANRNESWNMSDIANYRIG